MIFRLADISAPTTLQCMVRTGRPKLPPDAKRVAITHKVKPTTPDLLRGTADALGLSVGELIDVYAEGPKPKKPKPRTEDSGQD